MNKIKIFRLDVFFWILLLVFGGCWYLLEDKLKWQTLFLMTSGFYLLLSFIIRAVVLQSKREGQGVTQLSDIKKKQYDTATWLSARAVIINFNSLGKVMDKGKEVGRLFSFMIQLEGDDNSRWRTLVKNEIIPESHLTSFGKYTEMAVLYNPDNKYREVVFENDSWHYEKK